MLCYSSSALSAAVDTSESGHNYGHMRLYLLSQMINMALTRAESEEATLLKHLRWRFTIISFKP